MAGSVINGEPVHRHGVAIGVNLLVKAVIHKIHAGKWAYLLSSDPDVVF